MEYSSWSSESHHWWSQLFLKWRARHRWWWSNWCYRHRKCSDLLSGNSRPSASEGRCSSKKLDEVPGLFLYHGCFYRVIPFLSETLVSAQRNELSLILVDKKPIQVENRIRQQTVNVNNKHKRCNGPPVSLRRLPLLLLLLPSFLSSSSFLLLYSSFTSFFYSLVSSPTATFISRTYEALVTTIPSRFHMSYRWRCCWKWSQSPPIVLSTSLGVLLFRSSHCFLLWSSLLCFCLWSLNWDTSSRVSSSCPSHLTFPCSVCRRNSSLHIPPFLFTFRFLIFPFVYFIFY